MARKQVGGTVKEEINNARANLDCLLHKINASIETGTYSGATHSDDDDDHMPGLDSSPGRDGGAAGDTSLKKRGNTGKKRKRAESRPQDTSASNTYIVKLFDRSIDLAEYAEHSPLYPICRSWMRNTTNDQCIEQPLPSDQLSGGEIQFPEPYRTSKDEDLYKLRIPEPIKSGDKPLDIYAEPVDAADLLLKHIAHWKKIRQSWRIAGKAYEARFSTSHGLIKKMYETAAK